MIKLKNAEIKRELDDIKSTLDGVFEPSSSGHQQWGQYQTKCYLTIRTYIDRYRAMYSQYEHRNDKKTIMNNIVGQKWFIILGISDKNLIQGIVDRLEVCENFCHNTKDTKMLNLVIDLKKMKLVVKYYHLIGELVSLEIYTTDAKKKSYLAYNVRGKIARIPDEIKEKLTIPELDDLNSMLDIDEDLLDPMWIFKMLMEMVLYFDQTETIGLLRVADTDEDPSINDILEL